MSNEWIKLADATPGKKIKFECNPGGCIQPGSILEISKDLIGLYVNCRDGKHYIDSHFRDDGRLAGMTEVVEAALPPAKPVIDKLRTIGDAPIGTRLISYADLIVQRSSDCAKIEIPNGMNFEVVDHSAIDYISVVYEYEGKLFRASIYVEQYHCLELASPSERSPENDAISIDNTRKINVLDHGFVRLVEHMGNDLSIVRNARNSHDAAWRAGINEGSDSRLINYLWRNHHTTPFETVVFTFEVAAPIFVLRQWHRHRTWAYNEVSARYTELPEEFYVPEPPLIGQQSGTNKQARVISGKDGKVATFEQVRMTSIINDAAKTSFEAYRLLLAASCPRELARTVLPVGTYSKMFCTVNLLNLFRFLTLRCDSHAQYEIRVYAEALLSLIEEVCPVAVKAWRANDQKRFSYGDGVEKNSS